MRRIVHDFLRWLPVAAFGAMLGIAAIWTKAADWVANWAAWGWARMTDPWIAAFVLIAFISYIAAIIWTGIDRLAKDVPEKRLKGRMPLHKACHYIARDSSWAEAYQENDSHWVVVLSTDLQRSLSLGEITAYGHRQWDHGVPERGLSKIDAGFWTNATLDLSHIAAFHPPHGARSPSEQFALIELVEADVKERWPARSRRARCRKQSPVERIGGYERMWAEQDPNYAATREDLYLTVAERMYPDDRPAARPV